MKRENVYPNASVFLESTRSIGYSFEAAVADIIDNSISKNSRKIDIRFDSNFPMYLAVIDDGCGMTDAEIVDAMRYGSKSSLAEREKNDLGRFGLGLKMASLSQCRLLTVVSKINESVIGAEWNLDSVENWSLTIYEKSECTKLPGYNVLEQNNTGTLVLWRNFDRFINGSSDPASLFDKKIELTRKHLSLVFHRYIDDEAGARKIIIEMNGIRLKPIDPFMTSNSATQLMEQQVISINGENIYIKPYILPYVSKLGPEERRIQA